MVMDKTVQLLKLLSDRSRLRILMLLRHKELCVCQIMGVLKMSQPLISKNIALLKLAGLLSSRKEGKLVHYSLNKKITKSYITIIDAVADSISNDRSFINDLNSLTECEEFQKATGKCGMQGLREFMNRNNKRGQLKKSV